MVALLSYVVLGKSSQVPKSLLLPSPTPALQVTNVDSPDGTEKLTMQTQKGEKSTTYIFYISNIQNQTKTLLFSRYLSDGIMEIPLNTFSPDNKYVFLTQTTNGVSDYLVFKATGSPFSNGQNYLDVASLYAGRKINYLFDQVTGWDSPTLLHVYTNIDQAMKGPAFWFDVESQSFIQLARR